MSTSELQKVFFDKVKEGFTSDREVVTEIAELLNISPRSARRRFRSKTLLNVRELDLLARHFGIPLDEMVHRDQKLIPFHYNQFENKVSGFGDYIQQVYEHLQWVSQYPKINIFYASQEIPIFSFFPFPELLAFKLYIYGMTSWGLLISRHSPFDPRLVSPEVVRLARRCADLYAQIPSYDLWSLNILDNTLNQIEYLAIIDQFKDRELPFLLCDQLKEMLHQTREMAASGYKHVRDGAMRREEAEFHLFFNELISTNNTILLDGPDQSLVFTTFGNPNFLWTRNEELGKHLKNWFEMIIDQSTSIRISNERDRNYFFKRLEDKISQSQARLSEN